MSPPPRKFCSQPKLFFQPNNAQPIFPSCGAPTLNRGSKLLTTLKPCEKWGKWFFCCSFSLAFSAAEQRQSHCCLEEAHICTQVLNQLERVSVIFTTLIAACSCWHGTQKEPGRRKVDGKRDTQQNAKKRKINFMYFIILILL